MDASFREISTTLARRFNSLLRRSIRFVLCSFDLPPSNGPVLLLEDHGLI